MAFGNPSARNYDPRLNPQTGTYAPTDEDVVRGRSLYSFEDPQTAWDSVLRDRGINPYIANPFVQTMRQQARPLAQAYLMRNARLGAQQAQDQATRPYDFASYLNGVAGGQNPALGSNIYATIQGAAQQVPQTIDAIRAYQAAQQGGNVYQVNPFMEALAEQFAADNGMGSVGVLRNLYSPLMARPLAEAYGQGLNQAATGALYRGFNGPLDYSTDVWRWLYGR